MSDDTELQRRLRALAREAMSLADSLSRTPETNWPATIGWGVLAINGWTADVRDEAVKVSKRLSRLTTPGAAP